MGFNTISSRTFAELQLGAGLLLSSFDPTGTPGYSDEDIICATTGGINVSVVPTISDLGADIDNCPENTAELMRVDKWDVSISTTSLGLSADQIRFALGAATDTGTVITPRGIQMTDFQSELWWVGEVGAGGYAAVKLTNALSTGGFVLQTEKNGKGKVSLTITAHPSLDDPETVPVEFYADNSGTISLNKSTATVAVNSTTTLVATTVPVGQVVTWTSSAEAKATVVDGVVTGKSAGSATITASMTYGGQTYTATCSVTVS